MIMYRTGPALVAEGTAATKIRPKDEAQNDLCAVCGSRDVRGLAFLMRVTPTCGPINSEVTKHN